MITVARLQARLALIAALLALTACGGTVQESLGLGKRSPDEFQVVRRAPLVLPPDYNLRPPEPGATGPASRDVASQAEEILTGQPRVATETTQSQGELTLLAQTNVEATPGIRQVITSEDEELLSLDDSRFLFILNFQRRAMTPDGPVIDPVAETQRLQQAAAGTGSVVTQRTGSTPLAP
jgi:hypothetical protein